jgi:hypothetical protein
MCVLLQKYADKGRLELQDVLSTVAYTSITNTKASESCLTSHTRHVYGLVPDRILPGKKTLYYMQFGVPYCGIPDMLQWRWELFTVEQQL